MGSLREFMKSNRILLIEDNGSALKSILTLSNYTVCKLKASDNIIEIAKNFAPDLILSSYEQIEGNGIVEKIRESHYLANTPIIIIANRFNIKKAIKTLNGNVDDYVVKPFLPEELTARLNRIIHRHERVLNSNPLTKLPGNISIKDEIEKMLEQKKEFCVCYADLDNFKAFNDYYGYEKGDCAINMTGKIINESLISFDKSKKGTFLGHIGGDDFIFLAEIKDVKRICEDVVREFDEKILSLYEDRDINKGWIISKDRNGKRNMFPIMSISISVVRVRKNKKRHFGELSKIGTELKKYVKTFSGSNFIIDRRSMSFRGKDNEKEKIIPLFQNATDAKHFDKRF
ncbi:MAG: diguanylate cyclase [Candidatus Aureabacteria bacterium]|nr:diguanylate cyclase [Candidatus Auribacterota bacterium]